MSDSGSRNHRLLLGVSAAGLIACGGNAAGPDAPNPLGVPDTVVFAFSSPEVVIGDTLRLSVVARDAGGNVVPNVVLVWQSLNPGVATVSADGLVTTHDIGEAEIEVEATVSGSSLALFVDSSHVGQTLLRNARSRFKIVSVPNVEISPTEATIPLKEAHQFTVRVTKKGGGELPNRPVIRWTSSNPSVATVTNGVAVAVSVGTTQITAAVTVGSSSKSATAKLTVQELPCGGIASVQTLYGRFSYKYVAGGTTPLGNRISSQYTAAVKSTMTRQADVDPQNPFVIWVGPLTGSATQDEKEFDRNDKEFQRLEGAGAPVNDVALANMYVEVDQRTCRFRIISDVAIDLRWTLNGTLRPRGSSASARLRIGSTPLDVRAGAPTPFPSVVDQPVAGHSLGYEAADPSQNAFIPYGLAIQLFANPGASEGAIGEALVGYEISKVPFVNFAAATIATQPHRIGASIPQSAAADAFHSRRRLR